MKFNVTTEYLRAASPVKFWLYTRLPFAAFLAIEAVIVYFGFKCAQSLFGS